MDVILLERIEKLGQMGDVVSVKPGYARNYLLPQNKALRATEENKRRFEDERVQREATNLQRRTEAEAVAGKLDGLVVVLIRQAGEAGQLYGSVTARDIADAVTEAGFTIERRQIALANPIKALGLHDVHVNLHPEVAVDIVANVARSTDEAETQAKTGKAVVGRDEIEEVTIEEQAEAVFEEDQVEHVIEEIHAEEAAEADLDRTAAPAEEAEEAVTPAEDADTESTT